jgi:hypothetical protein
VNHPNGSTVLPAFIHSPQRMTSVLEAAGFIRTAHRRVHRVPVLHLGLLTMLFSGSPSVR